MSQTKLSGRIGGTRKKKLIPLDGQQSLDDWLKPVGEVAATLTPPQRPTQLNNIVAAPDQYTGNIPIPRLDRKEFQIIHWNTHGKGNRDQWWEKTATIKSYRPTVISLNETWSSKIKIHGYQSFPALAPPTNAK